ncbi:MAG: hypothetical protein ABWW65_02580, partial [Thermoprotei archaeon]
ALYTRTVSGIKELYLNDEYLFLVHAYLEKLIYNKPYIYVAIRDQTGYSLLVFRGYEPIRGIHGIRRGIISGISYRFNTLKIGFSGDKLYGIASIETDTGEQRFYLLECIGGEYSYEEYSGLLKELGWNGEWYSALHIVDDKQYLLFFEYNGKKRRYRIKNKIFKEYVKIESIYYNNRLEIAVLRKDTEILGVNLGSGEVSWKIDVALESKTHTHPSSSAYIAVPRENEVLLLDVTSGKVICNKLFKKRVNTALTDGKILAVGVENILYIYQISDNECIEKAKYILPGSVVMLNIEYPEILIAYLFPINTLKVYRANLEESEEVSIEDVILVSNTAVDLPVSGFIGDIRVFKSTSPLIGVIKRDNRFLIFDKGSEPGNYRVTLLFEKPGYLSVLHDINVKIENPKNAIQEIILDKEVVKHSLGAYIPVVIETIAPLDEVHVIVTSNSGLVAGSSNIIRDLDKGKHRIPVYILWGKSGKHDVTLHIVARIKHNKIYEKLDTTIELDQDIIPAYYHVSNNVLRIWVPIPLENTTINIVSGENTLTFNTSLKKGWNDLEIGNININEVIISIPNSDARIYAKRG